MSGDWLEQADADWLDEPEARYVGVIEAAENERRISAEAAVNDAKADAATALTILPRQVEIPADLFERSRLLASTAERLRPIQRMFLSMLDRCRYNVSKAVRMINLTPDGISLSQAKRWARDDEDYAFVLRVMKTSAAGEVVDRERLLLRADEIAEDALEPKPILHKGLPTGFYENKPDTALRANEQLMKTQKMLGNDDAPSGGIAGPALIIQVVQRDGAVIDVSPRGVTIDLPPPDGT